MPGQHVKKENDLLMGDIGILLGIVIIEFPSKRHPMAFDS